MPWLCPIAIIQQQVLSKVPKQKKPIRIRMGFFKNGTKSYASKASIET